MYAIASHDPDLGPLPQGWYLTLQEAAEACPKDRLFAPVKAKKQTEAERLKKMNGHPVVKVAPVVVEAPKPVVVEPVKPVVVEIRQYKDLTENDKADIRARLIGGDRPGEIAKKYNVHHLTIVKVKNELD